MSDSWVSLRQYAEGWLDDLIRDEPDPEARTMLIVNYDTIAAHVEADMQRQIVEQMAQGARH